jgi:hypothetical protein
MKRGTAKKSPVERRKTPRSNRAQVTSKVNPCQGCGKDLKGAERALFVEEEIGRIFCAEPCIAKFFAPEVERLEKEYLRRAQKSDLTGKEREALSHLRWATLQEPDEVWREKTLTGDYRYTLISQFEPGSRPVWSICICLFLQGEPSFLFIAFPTKNEAMVNAYRRGEQVKREKTKKAKKTAAKASPQSAEEDAPPSPELGDRLADAWTEDETFLAQVSQERSEGDIPAAQYELYQGCLEQTLEEPDEVWSLEMTDPDGVHLYHFIRQYPNEEPGHWYIIVAKETDEEEQIEILDAFPTQDASLVDRYRRGSQEVGELTELPQASRMVH